jgi:hypothetical protein
MHARIKQANWTNYTFGLHPQLQGIALAWIGRACALLLRVPLQQATQRRQLEHSVIVIMPVAILQMCVVG